MSTTEAIFGSATSQSTTNTQNKNKNNELGKDSFLNLLVTQLRNQNPLDPVSDTDFIAQMAQFSSLEQMQNMNKEVTNSRATSLVGKTIQFTHPETGELQSGYVNGVKMVDGSTVLIVGDIDVPMDKIQQIWDFNQLNLLEQLLNLNNEITSSRAASLLGKNIEFIDPETEELQTGQVSGVKMVDGSPVLVVGDVEVSLDKIQRVWV